MEVKARINGVEAILHGKEDERLRDVLYREGYSSVRDSDDAEGFAGSDTIVFDGALRYSNLIMLYQAEGKTILEVIDDGTGIPPDKMMELQDSMDQSMTESTANVSVQLSRGGTMTYQVSFVRADNHIGWVVSNVSVDLGGDSSATDTQSDSGGDSTSDLSSSLESDTSVDSSLDAETDSDASSSASADDASSE